MTKTIRVPRPLVAVLIPAGVVVSAMAVVGGLPVLFLASAAALMGFAGWPLLSKMSFEDFVGSDALTMTTAGFLVLLTGFIWWGAFFGGSRVSEVLVHQAVWLVLSALIAAAYLTHMAGGFAERRIVASRTFALLVFLCSVSIFLLAEATLWLT